ncbi:hypothetical protein A2U01_0039781, partial [Trifolium medium]|nr:hypothetical protein [Trifolium medium]
AGEQDWIVSDLVRLRVAEAKSWRAGIFTFLLGSLLVCSGGASREETRQVRSYAS